MELKFEQYTINGTPEEIAEFLKSHMLTRKCTTQNSSSTQIGSGVSSNSIGTTIK